MEKKEKLQSLNSYMKNKGHCEGLFFFIKLLPKILLNISMNKLHEF